MNAQFAAFAAYLLVDEGNRSVDSERTANLIGIFGLQFSFVARHEPKRRLQSFFAIVVPQIRQTANMREKPTVDRRVGLVRRLGDERLQRVRTRFGTFRLNPTGLTTGFGIVSKRIYEGESTLIVSRRSDDVLVPTCVRDEHGQMNE